MEEKIKILIKGYKEVYNEALIDLKIEDSECYSDSSMEYLDSLKGYIDDLEELLDV